MPHDSSPSTTHGDPWDAAPGSSLDELELAYQRALAAVEAIESTLPDELASLPAAETDSESSDPTQAPADDAAFHLRSAAINAGRPASSEPSARVTPRQVIEAALFVGGGPLTARKLSALLRDDSDHEFIDRTIEALNQHYAAQGRPCSIRLAQGGYRMELRSEFDGVRNRVFGYGPKEVRLSQDAVETLAVVAYRQPLTRQDVEHALQRPAGSILNQLLRRELIALERHAGADGEVTYRTTPRFLGLFGLAGIHELPQPDDLSFK